MRNLALFIICCCIFSSGTLLSQDDWQSENTPPFNPRNHPVTFTIDGMGYVTTGYFENSQGGFLFRDVHQFDPSDNSWTEMNTFPGLPRGFAYGASYEGKGYLGFGLGVEDQQTYILNDLWEYDPETDQWEQLPNCPCEGRRHPAFVIVNGSVFVGAGDNTQMDLKDFWKYDIENEEWTQIDDLPGPQRHHPYYFGIDDDMYVGFGHSSQSIYSDFYKYNSVTDEWTQLNDFPGEGRVAGTQFSYDGKGYVLSGQGEDHQNFDEGEFWEYDPETDSWTQLESHPGISSRWAPGSFIIDGKVYLIAGRDDTGDINSIYTYPLEEGIVSVKETENFDLYVSNGKVNLNVEKASNLKFRVFDVSGNIQMETNNELYTTGEHTIDLNLNDLNKKAYFINAYDQNENQNYMIKFIK